MRNIPTSSGVDLDRVLARPAVAPVVGPLEATRTGALQVVPGDPASRVLLHVPHAGVHLPASARSSIVLDDDALTAEVGHMTDAHTDTLATVAADLAVAAGARRPWLLVNRCSRLVVDPERFPDATEEMNTVGMGVVYTHTAHRGLLRHPDRARDTRLRRAWFDPYADTVADTVAGRLHSTGSCVLLDVHSYPTRPLPYELHADTPRPPVCLGVDDTHTPALLLDAGYAAFDHLTGRLGDGRGVAVNVPFAGSYVPLRHYRRDPRVASLMVELRRDTYMVEPGGRTHAGAAAVAVALANLVVATDTSAPGPTRS